MRAAVIVACLLASTIVAAAAFAIVYVIHPQTQLAAALIGLALAALTAAVVVFEHELMPNPQAVEDRGELPSGDAKNEDAVTTLLAGANKVIGTRPWILRLFAGAVATLGVAVLFPLRSLAPPGARAANVGKTSWRSGLRAVREDGTLVRASDLDVNSVLTVFPEGYVGPQFANEMANDATVLVRVNPNEVQLPVARATWAPDGILAFSKVCTHAGCPVGLYRAAARQLFCPCHQSTFDVLTGGTRIFGPAARALPQLPITIAADDTIEARSDYPEPIGPGYWERS